MKISVDASSLRSLQQALDGFSDRRLNATVATALTRTTSAIRPEWQSMLSQRLDRPTPATLASVRTQGASAANLQTVAQIDPKARANQNSPAEWLTPQERAGSRRLKVFERVLAEAGAIPAGFRLVPGPGAEIDNYGNVTRRQLTAIIRELGPSALRGGYGRVISPVAAKRAKAVKRHGRSYVAIPPNASGRGGGIYERKGDKLTPVLWATRSVRYQQSIDLEGLGRDRVKPLFEREWYRAVADSWGRQVQARATAR